MFKTKDIISKITIIIGILVIVYSAVNFFSHEQKYPNSDIIEGIVVNYEKNYRGINVPLVKYIVNNDTFYLKSITEIGTFPKENRVYIEYNIDNPKEAVIYESYINYGIPISIATIGLMITVFVFVMLYFSWKKRV